MKLILKIYRFKILLIIINGSFSYQPGSPDRNLSVLQTADVTENKYLLTRFNHRFFDPFFPEAESNPAYHWFGLDGKANIYLDASFGFANIFEVTISRQRQKKIYGMEGKALIWSQRIDKKPLSISFTSNLQIKTQREMRNKDRYSLGGSVILSKSIYNEKLEMLLNGLIQSHTHENKKISGEPIHSAAVGVGLIYRIDRVSLFYEWTKPMELGLWRLGYVEINQLAGKEERGIPMQAFGFNYRIYKHSFAFIISNYIDIHAVNFIKGAVPRGGRINEFRLGFNLTRTFRLMH